MRNPVFFAGIAALVVATPFAAWAGEPRGPAFGNLRCDASISPPYGGADSDDYVATLAAGDVISVSVAASAKSELLPAVSFVAPDGSVVDPGAKIRGGGRSASVKSFTIPATGLWAVRVSGADGTEGAYSARFHVTPAKKTRVAKQHLGGDDALTGSQEFQAVAGSALTLTIKSAGKGAPVRLLSLTGPDDLPVAGWESAVVVHGNSTSIKGLPLPGTGTYRFEVGIDALDATWTANIAVAPPERPKGSQEFADEPRLEPRVTPLDGIVGQAARLAGGHYPVVLPYAKVWIGDTRATVLAVGPGGAYMDIVVPPAPGDTIADVCVQNPDGQAATRTAYFHYVPQGPLDVASIEPNYARVAQGLNQTFKVSMTRLATPPGVDVQLTTTAALGEMGTFVHIPGNASSATFTLTAGQELVSGEVRATYASTVAADVGVVPPGQVASITPSSLQILYSQQQVFTVALTSPAPTAGVDVALAIPAGIGSGPSSVHFGGGKQTTTFTFTAGSSRNTGTIKATLGADAFTSINVNAPTTLDLSGWKVEQKYSTLSYTIPQGTTLNVGECIVIGRNASKTQFVNAWRVTWDTTVHYLDGGSFPDIDGYETVQLKNKDGVSVDGPTIQMAAMGGYIYGRIAGTPAGSYTPASWLAFNMSGVQGGLPGSGEQPANNYPGIYISKFSDSPTGAYDFVEIYFDQLP